MPQDGAETSETAKPPRKSHRRRRLIVIILILLLLVGGYFLWKYLTRSEHQPIRLSGRIEGYETDVGAKIGGRVDYIALREGNLVKKGQLIVRISDTETVAQLKAATANAAAIAQNEKKALLQLDVIRRQIAQAQLTVQQAKGESQGDIAQASASASALQAQVTAAEEGLVQARTDLELAQRDQSRYAPLVPEGAITRQVYDQTVTRLENSQAALASRKANLSAAIQQVRAARGTLVRARTTALNPSIRTEELEVVRKQLEQAKTQLEAAKYNTLSAQATREQILAQLDYLHIRSPIDGVVTARTVEPGAVVGVGQVVLSLINLKTVYLRGYIPEGQIGLVRLGQRTQVFLDSAPDKPLPGHVIEIDPVASFTPENIYFQNDRVKQVFGLKIGIDNPAGFAKPGMPADGIIFTEDETNNEPNPQPSEPLRIRKRGKDVP